MSVKLSLKSLKAIVVEKGPLNYEQLVEHLDANKVVYSNEMVLKGILQESIDKGNFVLVDGNYAAKPRQSTGGAAPTRMFWVDKPTEPEKAKIIEKPYDAEKAAANELIATTPLGAIKAAKAYFYRTVYWDGLEIYRQLEEAHSPKSDAEAAPETEQAA